MSWDGDSVTFTLGRADTWRAINALAERGHDETRAGHHLDAARCHDVAAILLDRMRMEVTAQHHREFAERARARHEARSAPRHIGEAVRAIESRAGVDYDDQPMHGR